MTVAEFVTVFASGTSFGFFLGVIYYRYFFRL